MNNYYDSRKITDPMYLEKDKEFADLYRQVENCMNKYCYENRSVVSYKSFLENPSKNEKIHITEVIDNSLKKAKSDNIEGAVDYLMITANKAESYGDLLYLGEDLENSIVDSLNKISVNIDSLYRDDAETLSGSLLADNSRIMFEYDVESEAIKFLSDSLKTLPVVLQNEQKKQLIKEEIEEKCNEFLINERINKDYDFER